MALRCFMRCLKAWVCASHLATSSGSLTHSVLAGPGINEQGSFGLGSRFLDPFVPDDFINECWPHGPTGGRHCEHTSAQLFRVHLLCLLSPVHSVNLLIKMLPEQRAWRKFAALRRQSRVPDVRMMHQFRCRVGVAGLRRINQHLLAPLLATYAWQPWSVGLIDATDLPAAGVGFKKKHRAVLRRARYVGRAHAQDGAEPMFRRLQETHATPV